MGDGAGKKNEEDFGIFGYGVFYGFCGLRWRRLEEIECNPSW